MNISEASMSGISRENLARACLEPEFQMEEAVVPEPYVPHLPASWRAGGLLVVSEAQNLSDTYGDYVIWLRGLSREERCDRLNRWPHPDRIGVKPWEDGTLKLAVAAVFGFDAVEGAAVSNAILWSMKGAANTRPPRAWYAPAQKLWKALLAELKPGNILAIGKVAQEVITPIAPPAQVLNLRSASPLQVNPASGWLEEDDLLKAFPQARRVVEAPESRGWLREGRRAKVFYACHAVSKAQSGQLLAKTR